MKKFFEMGGVIAGVLLVVFGIGAIVIGFTGRSEVQSNIKREAIVGSPDMTPSAIKSEAAKAGLTNVDLPTLQRRQRADHHGRRGEVLRDLHADPHARGHGRLHVLADGPLPGADTAPKGELAEGGGTDNPTYAATDPKTGAAGRERCPRSLGDRDRADDRAQHLVLRRAGRAVQHRHGLRAPA